MNLYNANKTFRVMDINSEREMIKTKISYGENLIQDICDLIGIEGKDVENNYGISIYTLFIDNHELMWDDFADYMFPKSISCNSGKVIGANIFGDGTLEFILDKENEPKPWTDFSIDELKTISTYIISLKNNN